MVGDWSFFLTRSIVTERADACDDFWRRLVFGSMPRTSVGGTFFHTLSLSAFATEEIAMHSLAVPVGRSLGHEMDSQAIRQACLP